MPFASPDVDDGHNVHAVYEDGHTRGPRSQTPEDACLARMGVDDLRPVAAKDPHQIAQGSYVTERRDRLHQAAQLDDLDAHIDRGEDLPPRLSAVDEHDGVTGAHGLVAGDDRVFIRAAVDKPCDDVGNP
jgi:hypothetical protein